MADSSATIAKRSNRCGKPIATLGRRSSTGSAIATVSCGAASQKLGSAAPRVVIWTADCRVLGRHEPAEPPISTERLMEMDRGDTGDGIAANRRAEPSRPSARKGATRMTTDDIERQQRRRLHVEFALRELTANLMRGILRLPPHGQWRRCPSLAR